MGGRVHGDQPLGTVQEQRAGQDRKQDEARAERGAAVDPGGRAQAVGWGRRWRPGVHAGRGRRSVGMEQRRQKMPDPDVSDQGCD
jgi:hypothetical protein